MMLDEAVAWSAKYGECPAGDPDLHHYIGELLYKEGAFVQAEPHLLSAGKRDSARLLGQLLAEWSKASVEGELGLFAARGVLPYVELETSSPRAFLLSFLAAAALPGMTALPVGDTGDEVVLTSYIHLKFLQIAGARCRSWIRLFDSSEGTSRAASPSRIRGYGRRSMPLRDLLDQPAAAGNAPGDLFSGLFGCSGSPAAGTGGGRPAARLAAEGFYRRLRSD